ncbi:MAG: hypothetical protein GQ477_04475 [Nanohaloarchaea archaeon]|nr:hypothetical protein [Candidatus Nanohaloarchaea archaeon]
MTSQKATLDGILNSLAEEYDVDNLDTIQTINKTKISDSEDAIFETIEYNEDPTQISSNIIDTLREHYGKIKLNDECSIVCDGRYGSVLINDEILVKYIISKNVIEHTKEGIMLFDVLFFFESPDTTFYAAPRYFRPFFGNNHYGNIDSERIHKAIHNMKKTEYYHFEDKI